MGRLQWDVPPIGRPVALRGRKDAAVVLDEFVPTTIDVWRGRAIVVPAAVTGVPSDAPELVPHDREGALVARALVVRHGGDVAGRTPTFGARRRRLDHLMNADPPDEPLVAIVIEPTGVMVGWVRGAHDVLAAELSKPDWRAATGW